MEDIKPINNFEDRDPSQEPVLEITTRSKKITLEGFRAVRTAGLHENEEIALTDRHLELIAESILQVLYNLGTTTGAYLDYTMKLEGGTSYYTANDEVLVCPLEGEHYRRRIRNNRDILQK